MIESSSAGGRSYLAEADNTPLAIRWQKLGLQAGTFQRTLFLRAQIVSARQVALGSAALASPAGARSPGTAAGSSAGSPASAEACNPGNARAPARAASARRRVGLSRANSTESSKRRNGEAHSFARPTSMHVTCVP